VSPVALIAAAGVVIPVVVVAFVVVVAAADAVLGRMHDTSLCCNQYDDVSSNYRLLTYFLTYLHTEMSPP
jgi:hypothetical protein